MTFSSFFTLEAPNDLTILFEDKIYTVVVQLSKMYIVHRGAREDIQVVQLQKVRKLIWNWKIETKSSAIVPVFICNHKAAAVYKSHHSVRREHCCVNRPVATSGRKGEIEFFL